MAYSADVFVADEQPTTSKWNKLWSNDQSFNDGTGIGDNAIVARHIASAQLTNAMLNTTDSEIGGAWLAYTPTMTGSTSNPNIGASGVISGRYKKIGKKVEGYITVLVSGAGVNVGSGTYRYSLPTTADISMLSASVPTMPLGLANLILTGGTTNHHATLDLTNSSGSYVVCRLWTTAGAANDPVKSLGLHSSSIGQIAASDNISIHFSYWEA